MAEQQQLSLEVSTPLGRALEVHSDSVQLPGVAGEFGVLPGHLPILAATKPGVMKYREAGQMKYAAVGAGFAEADATSVRLISEFFVREKDVSLEDAQRDLSAADARMKEFKGELGDPVFIEIQRDLDWAQARIELASTKH